MKHNHQYFLIIILILSFTTNTHGEDKRRVLIIGLDGADWGILDPMLTEGELPNLQSIIDGGARGVLSSVQPPISPPAWRTAITGVNPGKHGVYEFPGRQEERYGMVFKKSFDKRAKPCWVYLSERDVTSLFINIPTMYPPEPIKGHMITGLYTPDTKGDFTFPPELREKYSDYEIDVTCEFTLDSLDQYVGDLRRIAEKRKEVIIEEMKEVDWDFAWVAFTGCDRVQHRYRGFNQPESLLYHYVNRGKYISTIRDFWILLDGALGEILENRPPNTLVMLMSDHGHVYSDSIVLLYGWLKSLGLMYAEMKPMEIPWYKKIFLSDETIDLTKRITIDWTKTKAYGSGLMGQIFINLKGREPHGSVEPGKEYEEVRDRIINAAGSLLDPKTGKPAIKAIHKREELYKGKYFDDAPDLLIEWNHPYSVVDKIPTETGTDGKMHIVDDIFGGEAALYTGIHRVEGIVVLNGSGIQKGKEIEKATLYDLLPTAYSYLGISIPDYMEGRVIQSFDDERLYTPSYMKDDLYIDEPEGNDLTEDERAAFTRQMKALGYIK